MKLDPPGDDRRPGLRTMPTVGLNGLKGRQGLTR